MARRYPPGPFEPFGPRGPSFENVGEIRIPRPPRRFWIGLGFIAAAILLLIVAAPVVHTITDYQWFSALGFGGAYGTRLLLQWELFLISFVAALAFSLGNVMIALRSRSGTVLRAVGIRRRTLRTGPGLVGLAVCALLALSLALSMRGNWGDLILFQHRVDTGIRDPIFNVDVSFYLLSLPFLQDIRGWLMALLVVTVLLVLALHAWRGDHFDLRLPPRGIAHVSGLLGLLALLGVFGAWLDRFGYLYGSDSTVAGAGYADINARIPLTTMFIGLNFLLAVALTANIWLRRVRLVLGGIGVALVATILTAIYPAIVQRVVVQPSELTQEQRYIQREIAFTRHAYGLDHVQSSTFGGDRQINAQDVAADQATINNLRLWDAPQLQDTYQQLQSIRTYYSFKDIDVDRYTINGSYQQVEISAREVDQSKLPPQAQNWFNQRLQYTHGYGAAASPVSQVVGEGLPQFVAQDVPPTGPLRITRPQIYFGQLESDYVLAPTQQAEFDYPSGADNVRNHWTGTDAPQLNGINRLLWSMRAGDFNLLVSSQVTNNTRILYLRNVQDRVQQLAPFLTLNESPYLVVVNGRLYWIQDALITSGNYPYSQQYDLNGTNVNYVRNSVKAVVDAYDGSVRFYVADPADPIVKAYQGAFPGMFQPLSAMPAGLQAHLRVPQSLFNVQANIYATYHISDPATLYNREDVWQTPVMPYYVIMRLPGQSRPEYLMILPYTPRNKQNLVGWIAVRQDAPHYGQMVSYVLPKDKVVFGPNQVASRIDQTTQISADYTLLNQSGTQVAKGNLLVVPIGDSFLYFEPWYLKATGQQSLPELKKVILAGSTNQGTVAYQNNLADAVNQLVGEAVAQPQPGTGTLVPTTSSNAAQIAQLTQQALQHYNAAQAALKQGDLGTYATEMNTVGGILQQIDALQKAQSNGSPAPSPSPALTPRPRASPSPSRSPGG